MASLSPKTTTRGATGQRAHHHRKESTIITPHHTTWQEEDAPGDLLDQLRESAIEVKAAQQAATDAVHRRNQLLAHAANVRRTTLAGTSLETIAAAGGVTAETLRKIRKK